MSRILAVAVPATEGRQPPYRWLAPSAAAAVVAAMLLSGCTGGRELAGPPPTPTTTRTPVAPATSTASETTPSPTAIEFAFQPPDPACPPAAELQTLPLAGQRSYELDPFLDEGSEDFFMLCAYERAEVVGEDEDMVLEDHALITSQIKLYPSWEDSPWVSIYPELPDISDALTDWEVAVAIRDDPRVWWEGCGSGTPCAEGEDPTVQTQMQLLRFQGHIGNLEFYVRIGYIAQRLPADVETRLIAIFRDLVLAIMDSYEPVD